MRSQQSLAQPFGAGPRPSTCIFLVTRATTEHIHILVAGKLSRCQDCGTFLNRIFTSNILEHKDVYGLRNEPPPQEIILFMKS